MNVFELSFIASPVVGGICGAVQGSKAGTVPAFVGLIIGILIGAGLHFTIVFLTSLAVTRFKLDKNDKLKITQWIISLLSVLFIASSPLLVFYIVNIIVKLMYHIS